MKNPTLLEFPMPNGSGITELVNIPGGTFTRLNDAEKPVSEVEVSDFKMSRYAVTFEQYICFATATGKKIPGACGWGKGSRPIIKVNWNDATAYSIWLSEILGQFFRLPTEAEWEYACRSGTSSDYYFGASITSEQVNFNRTIGKTMPVGSYPPNSLGLNEMHGNVWEWCSDWYGKYPEGKVKDPKGPDNGKYRVLRGGSWFVNAQLTRSSSRACDEPGERDHSRGFRLAMGQPK